MKIEFCVTSIEGAVAAEQFKADRIELCSRLDLDGLTPSLNLIQQCRSEYKGEIHIMIRPEDGPFICNDSMLNKMQNSIVKSAELGINGIVFGLLTNKNEVNLKATALLVEMAKRYHLETTFHRAFDYLTDPIVSVKQLHDLGINRILCSGSNTNVEKGIQLLKKLKITAQNDIEIMAGGGVNQYNAPILKQIGLDAIHFSIHNNKDNTPVYNQVNEEKIKSILRALEY